LHASSSASLGGQSSSAAGSTSSSVASSGRRTAPNDFDGDGKSDLALFCPATAALWYIIYSSGGSNYDTPLQLGTYNSIPVTGDYDGDGTTDPAVYTPRSSGEHPTWRIQYSATGTRSDPMAWGFPGTIPAPADYDGDAKTDVAVYYPPAGQWFIIFSSTGQGNAHDPAQFGYLGTHPVPADYDGDRIADCAVYDEQAAITWFARRSSDQSAIYPTGREHGTRADLPVPADYDGDGRADLAVFRPSDATWRITYSGGGPDSVIQFGGLKDTPVPGDYDGDGKADLALYRAPRDGLPSRWFARSVTGQVIHDGVSWGYGTCRPLAPVEQVPEGHVLVPSGTFQMGASNGDTQACRSQCGWPFDIEKPHQVTISRDFWMKATEVTQGEWRTVTGGNPTIFTGCGDDCPVDNVSWFAMAAYANTLSTREGLTPCYFQDAAGTTVYDFAAAGRKARPTWPAGLTCEGYRLPTEAEWEYAARAGTTTPVFNGASNGTNVAAIAWYGANSQCSYAGCELENCRTDAGRIPPSGPHPVATKTPNNWGLYDTAGNLWEFVWDYFGEYPNGPVTDPTGPVSPAGFHVARGGSWLNGTAEARVSARDGDDCTCDDDNGPGAHTGFRVARSKP
jgi:formylglycine-generating enzyme required for sulfatase activity